MSGGSKQKEHPTDSKCPKCGLWYQDKGPSFMMHKQSCAGESATETSDSPEDSEGLGIPSPSEEKPKSHDVDCPDCGGDWVPTKEAIELVNTSEEKEQLRKYDRICVSCGWLW